jgi:surface antigen
MSGTAPYASSTPRNAPLRAARANCRAYAQFVPARSASGQKQNRSVGTADHEQQRDGSKQYVECVPEVLAVALGQRLDT